MFSRVELVTVTLTRVAVPRFYEMQYAETRQSMKVIRLNKRLKTASDVESQFTVDKQT